MNALSMPVQRRAWPLVAVILATLMLAASTARADDRATLPPTAPGAVPTDPVPVTGEGPERPPALPPAAPDGDARSTPAPAPPPTPPAAPATVSALDLDRYAGTWYEVARLPMFFQRNCASDVTARYSRRADGLLQVDNRCRKKNGKRVRALGKARLPDPARPGQLEVAFFLNFYADYWVLEVGDAPDYGYAVVSNPKRDNLWILSRRPVMDARLYQAILGRLRADGFDLKKLKSTLQTGHA